MMDMRKIIDLIDSGLRLRSTLTEQVVSIRGIPLNLFRNPPPPVLREMINRYENMRGLIIGNNVYWWDAGAATHDDMADELGVELCVENRLYLELGPPRQTRNATVIHDAFLVFAPHIWTMPRLLEQPVMGKYIKSPLFKVKD